MEVSMTNKYIAIAITLWFVVVLVCAVLFYAPLVSLMLQENAIASIYATEKTYTLSSGSLTLSACLLDDVEVVAPGDWVDVHGFKDKSVMVTGINGDTVQLRGSNSPLKPATGEHGIQIGTDITTNSITVVATPVRWMKAMVIVDGTGTVDAWLFGQGY
jgi:hypothetical protein